jgi:glycine oxidase
MQNPDILIIGAGIVGCSLAWELGKSGAQTIVVDAGKVGGAASSAAAGLLSPRFDDSATGPLLELCRRSAARYESWVNDLRAAGAGDIGFRRTGLLSISMSAEETTKLQATLPHDIAAGRRAEWLDRASLLRYEPALNDRVQGAAFYPDDAHVEPARLVAQVARVAALAGVEIHESEPVRKLEREGERITAVHTSSGCYRPGLVVLAAGAWAGELAEAIGLRLPTRPVKGQMLLADCRVPPIRTPLHAGEALLIPWPDGRLALGVTVEEAGFDDRVRLDSLLRILRQTIELVPAVGELALSYAWAGLRPATPDGLPYMGPLPPWKNFWISAGHFRKGTLLAPICAKLLAESIRAGRLCAELAPFTPNRI